MLAHFEIVIDLDLWDTWDRMSLEMSLGRRMLEIMVRLRSALAMTLVLTVLGPRDIVLLPASFVRCNLGGQSADSLSRI